MLSKFLKLFRKASVVVPGADQLSPGESRTIQLGEGLEGGKQILICRTADGEVSALDTQCPHEPGGRLMPGPLREGKNAVCPLHNFHFDAKTGRNMESMCKAVETYNIKEKNGEFHITL